MSKPEDEFAQQLDLVGVVYRREYLFHPDRKWRLDFMVFHNGEKVGVEIDGGVWKRGRHVRPRGYIGDMDKLNAATAQGIRVFRFEPNEHVKTGKALDLVLNTLGIENGNW